MAEAAGEKPEWGAPENNAVWTSEEKGADKTDQAGDEEDGIDRDTSDNRKTKKEENEKDSKEQSKEQAKASSVDRTKVVPFLVKVVVRSGGHKDLRDFSESEAVFLHTWKNASLREIACLLSRSKPDINDPEARLSFKAIYTDPAILSITSSNSRGRNTRESRPSAPSAATASTLKSKDLGQFSNSSRRVMADESKTLEDAKFVIGDMIEVSVVKGFSIVGASSSSNGPSSAPVSRALNENANSSSSFADRLGPRRGSFTESRRDGNSRREGGSGGSRFHPYGGSGPRDSRPGFSRGGDQHDHRDNRESGGREGRRGRW
ncbi:Sin3 associated polypeptide p18-domain-containing protein [Obelidium mucronatum]|nr:Sin3 associated polypeptide p18-domain-containing protein [Obelidium mucronatum]